MSLTFGYGTNGLADHRLDEALDVIAGLGYDGVALTLDHHHLDPFDPDLPARTRRVRRALEERSLRVVVETGARYVLDPWRKHSPTLVSHSGPGRDRRVELLRIAVRVAAELGAEAASFWSGTLEEQTPVEVGWDRLSRGVEQVLTEADKYGLTCAFEPEPGMFVDTLDGVLELRRRLGEPPGLCVTVDIGHLVCNEEQPVRDCLVGVGDLIANVQLDDMRRGTHEHLELGEGELDLSEALGTLMDIGYQGLASIELPRHSHAGPAVAERSMQVLQAASELARAERSTQERKQPTKQPTREVS